MAVVEKRGVARGMMAAHHDQGIAVALDLPCQSHNGVGLTGHAGETDQVGFKLLEGLFQNVRSRFQVGYGNGMPIQIPGDDLECQRLASENHLDRIDPVFLFGDASAAVGRVHEENFHTASHVGMLSLRQLLTRKGFEVRYPSSTASQPSIFNYIGSAGILQSEFD